MKQLFRNCEQLKIKSNYLLLFDISATTFKIRKGQNILKSYLRPKVRKM